VLYANLSPLKEPTIQQVKDPDKSAFICIQKWDLQDPKLEGFKTA
jgi:hypothetical protein